ncbi:hypothetical protein FQR65_LT09498 [Abscondita terminalis]|nr:hypothetical protein FQR65_LT09498 [Abscondita terminalis]
MLETRIKELEEYKEKEDKRRKKLNVVITRVKTDEDGVEAAVKKLFADQFNIQAPIEKPILIELMKKKRSINDQRIFVNNDLTYRERRIQKLLEKEQKKKEAREILFRYSIEMESDNEDHSIEQDMPNTQSNEDISNESAIETQVENQLTTDTPRNVCPLNPSTPVESMERNVKKRKLTQTQQVKHQMDEALKILKTAVTLPVNSDKRGEKDRIKLFADLLVAKLRRMEDHTQDLVMHEIDNLIFRFNTPQLRRIMEVAAIQNNTLVTPSSSSSQQSQPSPYSLLSPQSHQSQPSPHSQEAEGFQYTV